MTVQQQANEQHFISNTVQQHDGILKLVFQQR